MDNLKMHTPDRAEDNFRKLAALFPNAVTETVNEAGELVRAIDADVLRQEISAAVVEGPQERYQFTWPDKKKSVVLANAPLAKTLRLDRSRSVGRDGTRGGIDSENIYIEGDNLDALKLLQETYLGKVKMIYIDPPYNTGNDFIYNDDFSMKADEYAAASGQFDEEGNRLVQNTESNGRFHTDWLNMLYPRLRIAKDLLTDDGVIFISIDDNEVANLIKICDEIFGKSNFITDIIWEKRYTRNNDAKLMSTVIDHILCYRKSEARLILREPRTEKQNSTYSNPDNDPRGVWTSVLFTSQRTKEERPNLSYIIKNPITGQMVEHPTNAWKYSQQEYQRLEKEGRLYWGKEGKNSYPRIKRFLSELDDGVVPINLWYYKDTATLDEGTKMVDSLLGKDIFDYPKPLQIVKRMLNIMGEKDLIVLDFFSGSATTAHATIQLNAEDGGHRKFIMVQLPEICGEKSEARKAGYETICDIGEERIRRAGDKIRGETGADIDYGFRVFRVDSSNMQDVYYTPAEYSQNQLDLLAANIKPGRTPEDLLFQVMLDLGVLLSSSIEETVIDGKKVFSVADGYLLACFDNHVTEETMTEIAKRRPFYAVFRDSSLAADSAAANLEQIFAWYSPETERRVL
ncbi:MAG: site-specific DNA-methyltransferase [Oscillospiraceae bacterium]|nr:site-specific DNA-methyltransferase [Oscillospiraceae bacterium]